MQQIYVVNPKGGSGKTTVATQLAGYFAQAGKTTNIIDHDPQKSCMDWLKQRASNLPNIEVCSAISGMPSPKEVCIHDMPAAWQPQANNVSLSAGDCILIPVLPSSTDINSCVRFVMNLYRGEWMTSSVRMGLIANRVRRNTKSQEVLQAFLERVQLPLITELRDTQNYVSAMSQGATLFDLPVSRVSKDLAQWQPVIQWLGQPSQKKHNKKKQQEIVDACS